VSNGKKNQNQVLEYLNSAKGEVDLPACLISNAVLKFSSLARKVKAFSCLNYSYSIL